MYNKFQDIILECYYEIFGLAIYTYVKQYIPRYDIFGFVLSVAVHEVALV